MSYQSTKPEACSASGFFLLYDNQYPYLLSKLYFLFLAGKSFLTDAPTCDFSLPPNIYAPAMRKRKL